MSTVTSTWHLVYLWSALVFADSSFPHVLIKPQAIRDNPRPRPATSGKWQPQRELIKIQSNFPHHITTCMTHIYQKFMCNNRQKFKRNEGNKSKLNTFLIMPRQRVEGRERERQGQGGWQKGRRSWVTLVKKQVKLKNSFATTLDTQDFCVCSPPLSSSSPACSSYPLDMFFLLL